MRFNKEVYFQKIKPGEYNPETGNYEGDYTEDVLRFASIMDTKTETMKMVYGKIHQGSLTIILQSPMRKDFDQILYKGKVYQADYVRNQRTFIVSEKQGGGSRGYHTQRAR